MCARFTQLMTWREVWELYQMRLPLPEEELRPRYNIAPTQSVAVVRVQSRTGEREGVRLRWGLIPSWSTDLKIGQRLINARGETAADKPAFRSAFKTRRCVIPASGFFEWEQEGKQKLPHYIHARDGLPLSLAALWERWAPEDHAPLETVTILTCAANGFMGELHTRMPVVLEPKDLATWLDPHASAAHLQALVQSRPWSGIARRRVDPVVNNWRNDVPACIEAVPAAGAG
jgi:putative SOS response-associated peptidase YedK